MNNIEAFLDAEQAWRDGEMDAWFLAVKSSDAAPEIMELTALCRKITSRGRTISADDLDRIRELLK